MTLTTPQELFKETSTHNVCLYMDSILRLKTLYNTCKARLCNVMNV